MFAKRVARKQTRRGLLSETAEELLTTQQAANVDNKSSEGGVETEAANHREDTHKEIAYHTSSEKCVRTYACSSTSGSQTSTASQQLIRRNKVPITGQKRFLYTTSQRPKHAPEETLHKFQSDRRLNLHDDNRATAVLDVDTDKAHDHRAILERNALIGEKIEKGELEAGLYRGQGAHRVYVKRREGALSHAKTTGLYGPVRGTNNVRMTMYVDYNPEICKDYKETGYCGFGNTCKFMHDRHDYKGGWQIEQEWQAKQKKKQEKLRKLAEGVLVSDEDSSDSTDSSSLEDEDQLPFACLKCRRKWEEKMNPVVTQCGHYFCEECAYSHHKENIKCFQCGRETQGIFNAAHDLLKKVQNVQKAVDQRKQRRRSTNSEHHKSSCNNSDAESDRSVTE